MEKQNKQNLVLTVDERKTKLCFSVHIFKQTLIKHLVMVIYS